MSLCTNAVVVVYINNVYKCDESRVVVVVIFNHHHRPFASTCVRRAFWLVHDQS